MVNPAEKITVVGLAKLVTAIMTIVGSWLFLESQFVSAGDYIAAENAQNTQFRKDQLANRSAFIEMQLYLLDDRIQLEEDKFEPDKYDLRKLERRKGNLEIQQQAIVNEQMKM